MRVGRGLVFAVCRCGLLFAVAGVAVRCLLHVVGCSLLIVCNASCVVRYVVLLFVVVGCCLLVALFFVGCVCVFVGCRCLCCVVARWLSSVVWCCVLFVVC